MASRNRHFLDLPYGIPGSHTFWRVAKCLDTKSFGACLWQWSGELISFLADKHIIIDGKVLRGSGQAGKPKSGLYLVSAWVAEQRLVLGQQQVDQKSNEKTAIPLLIDSLDLEQAVVSIDAIACQPEIAEKSSTKEVTTHWI